MRKYYCWQFQSSYARQYGYGHYELTYTLKSGKSYSCITTDAQLFDAIRDRDEFTSQRQFAKWASYIRYMTKKNTFY